MAKETLLDLIKLRREIVQTCRIDHDETFHLADHDPAWLGPEEMSVLGHKVLRKRAKRFLKNNLSDLKEAQELLYASNKYSLLLIFQAMDAAGKDGTIKHVMSGVNPQGCQVSSYKKPSSKELDHNFLWRYNKGLPERGRIGIFNRSYYEEVLVVKVHPEILATQRLPNKNANDAFWAARYEDINNLEKHLTRNGTVVLKFFLNVSKEEQKRRFMKRLNDPERHWKFSSADLEVRQYWDDYMAAFEAAINATATPWAPWYVIPADNKWIMRAIVAGIVTQAILSLGLSYPAITPEKKERMKRARQLLAEEE